MADGLGGLLGSIGSGIGDFFGDFANNLGLTDNINAIDTGGISDTVYGKGLDGAMGYFDLDDKNLLSGSAMGGFDSAGKGYGSLPSMSSGNTFNLRNNGGVGTFNDGTYSRGGLGMSGVGAGSGSGGNSLFGDFKLTDALSAGYDLWKYNDMKDMRNKEKEYESKIAITPYNNKQALDKSRQASMYGGYVPYEPTKLEEYKA